MKDTIMKDTIREFAVFPRNKNDWYGSMVLFSVNNNIFYRVDFGCGDNLTCEDMNNGFDDYLNLEAFSWDGEIPLRDIFGKLQSDDYCLDEINGLSEEDGGMMLLKHSDWESGDIRRMLGEALDFVGYGSPSVEEWGKDLICVALHD